MFQLIARVSLAVFLCISPVFALTPEEAAAHEGEKVSVTSQCSNAKKVKSGAVYINFGGDFPNQTFSVWINPKDAEAFTDLESYSGKTFTVTGTVKLKNGKPEMSVVAPEQIVPTPAEGDAADPAAAK